MLKDSYVYQCKNQNKYLAFLLYSLIFISFSIWIIKLQNSNKTDQYYINKYRDEIEKESSLNIPKIEGNIIRDHNFWWTFSEISITFLIMLVSWLLLF